MGFVMAAFSFSAARSMPNQRAAMSVWGYAMASSGSAFLLYFLRGHISWMVSFVGGNALILLGPLLILKAQTLLVGATLNLRLLAVLSVWSLAGVVVAVAFGSGPVLGAITMSSGIALVALLYLHHQLRHPLSRTLPGSRFAAGVGALTAITFAWRTWVAITGQLPPINDTTPNTNAAHTGSLLMGALFLAAASISFFNMAHEVRRRETEDGARRDGLTGVLTRAAFYEMAEALHRHQPAVPMAIAMVDLDHFKSVNDRYGHAGGDHALAHMARLISGAMRTSDLIGRYGGEEFVVLLRDGDTSTAQRFGERLVELANRQRVRMPGNQVLLCTLSVGLACRSEVPGTPPETLDALIARADHALYEAKAQGRNRAVLAAQA